MAGEDKGVNPLLQNKLLFQISQYILMLNTFGLIYSRKTKNLFIHQYWTPGDVAKALLRCWHFDFGFFVLPLETTKIVILDNNISQYILMLNMFRFTASRKAKELLSFFLSFISKGRVVLFSSLILNSRRHVVVYWVV